MRRLEVQAPRLRPLAVVGQIIVDFRLNLVFQIPQHRAEEQVVRDMVRVGVRRVRHEHLRGLEIRNHLAQVFQDRFALVRRVRGPGEPVRHLVLLGKHAPKRLAVAPAVLPDLERSEVRITEEGFVAALQAELAAGAHRLEGACLTRIDRRVGVQGERLAEEQEGKLVVVAVGQEYDLHGQALGDGLLNETARRQDFVVGVRRQNQDPVIIRQRQLRTIGRAGRRGRIVDEVGRGGRHLVRAAGRDDGQDPQQQHKEPASGRPRAQRARIAVGCHADAPCACEDARLRSRRSCQN